MVRPPETTEHREAGGLNRETLESVPNRSKRATSPSVGLSCVSMVSHCRHGLCRLGFGGMRRFPGTAADRLEPDGGLPLCTVRH